MLTEIISRSFFIVFLLVSFVSHSQSVTETSSLEEGKNLFESQGCKGCHSLGTIRKTGPGLYGVFERWDNDEAKLIRYIQNPADPEFGIVAMPAHPLPDNQIRSILMYINSYEPPVASAEDNVVMEKTEDESLSYELILLIAIVSLSLLIFLLTSVKNSLKESVSENTETIFQTIRRLVTVNPNKLILGFILLIFVLRIVYDTLMGVGVVEKYEPAQPIQFSHKVHAGDNQIDCNYCHTSARHSKTASIPSANLCMNCHTYINEGPISGTKEIQKIYDAVGFDPETRTYIDGYEQKPIEWIRVHQLPDLAYFNHSQHVSVANLECQQCHGNVQEKGLGAVATSEELNQIEFNIKDGVKFDHPTLTMGWCIDCHRQKTVDMENNDYYMEMHSKLIEKHGKEAFSVETIGGLECGKCHY